MLTFREFFGKRAVKLDDAAAANGGILSDADNLKRVSALYYGRATAAEQMRKMEGAVLTEILPQPFKSYREMLRTPMAQMTQPVQYDLLAKGAYLPSTCDFPKVFLQWNLVLCGWERANDTLYGPHHVFECSGLGQWIPSHFS
jgi:hypothetical protein